MANSLIALCKELNINKLRQFYNTHGNDQENILYQYTGFLISDLNRLFDSYGRFIYNDDNVNSIIYSMAKRKTLKLLDKDFETHFDELTNSFITYTYNNDKILGIFKVLSGHENYKSVISKYYKDGKLNSLFYSDAIARVNKKLLTTSEFYNELNQLQKKALSLPEKEFNVLQTILTIDNNLDRYFSLEGLTSEFYDLIINDEYFKADFDYLFMDDNDNYNYSNLSKHYTGEQINLLTAQKPKLK